RPTSSQPAGSTGMIRAAGQQLEVPVFEWSITTGLRRSDALEQTRGMTSEPVKLLHHISDMTIRAIYVAHDLAPHLTNDVTLQRVLRDTLAKLTGSGATLVSPGQPTRLSRRSTASRSTKPARPLPRCWSTAP
ncbi:MAG TPA: hypothetical protein PKB03_06095, partial [Baekduia sp.]|nr:hypothetical protein [Baekduia sp.]